MVSSVNSDPGVVETAYALPLQSESANKNPSVAQGFSTANSVSASDQTPAAAPTSTQIELDTPTTDDISAEDRRLQRELARQSVDMKIDSFRASVSYFNKKINAKDIDVSDGYTLMSLITGMLGDTLALIGAELIGNDFLDTALEKKKKEAVDRGEVNELKTRDKESKARSKELEGQIHWLTGRVEEYQGYYDNSLVWLDSMGIADGAIDGWGQPYIDEVDRDKVELDAMKDELQTRVDELEGVEGLTPQEKQLLSKAKALLFIISGAEFSVEKLIYRISQDFSKNSLDTGEENIAERRISERLAQNQSASAAEEQSNSRVAASLQEKQALKKAQAVIQGGSANAAPGQAHTPSEEGRTEELQPDGLLFNSAATSIPQVIPVEIAVAELENQATTLTATNPIQSEIGEPIRPADTADNQIKSASEIQGLSTQDRDFIDAFVVPPEPVDIIQLLAELEREETKKDGERLFYEAIAVAMRSDEGKQAQKERLNTELLAAFSAQPAENPQAFASQVLQIDAMLDEGGLREQSRIVEKELTADSAYLNGLKAAEFLAKIQDVPANVAESREEEEEVERLVLKASFV